MKARAIITVWRINSLPTWSNQWVAANLKDSVRAGRGLRGVHDDGQYWPTELRGVTVVDAANKWNKYLRNCWQVDKRISQESCMSLESNSMV